MSASAGETLRLCLLCLERSVHEEARGSTVMQAMKRRVSTCDVGALVRVVLLSFFLCGCKAQPEREPVTLVLLNRTWVESPYFEAYKQELQDFTKETGIQVVSPPAPESTQQQLALQQELLGRGASSPDVFGIDVIWAGLLEKYLLDLKPYFANQISGDFPIVANSYTVHGKLVAVPYRVDLGVLYYRTDLLHKYGYRLPPRTWDELETMAARIQAGERAKGNKEFWGFVWQGADAEALTCNALEWQASEGGGHIIEQDKTITVNNPATIRAWQRASHWIGWISPPSIVAFEEFDARNVWVRGNAAFMRDWSIGYSVNHAPGSRVRDHFAVSLLPAGRTGPVGTLGGIGLAVSRFSTHPREAIELVRYLTRKDVEMKRSQLLSGLATGPELNQQLRDSGKDSNFSAVIEEFSTSVVSRPSNITSSKYESVGSAYAHAVHSVLTGKRGAQEAAAGLERDLVRLTGFKTGPPELEPPHR